MYPLFSYKMDLKKVEIGMSRRFCKIESSKRTEKELSKIKSVMSWFEESMIY